MSFRLKTSSTLLADTEHEALTGFHRSGTHKRGASRLCHLKARRLRAINDCLQDYEAFWDATMHELKRYVEEDR